MGSLRRRRRSVPAVDARAGGAGDGGDVSAGWAEAVREAARDALAALVGDRIYGVGGQAAVYVDGRLVADAVAGVTGSGIPMRPDHLHHGFCMLKPQPFLLLAGAAEEAGFGPDDPLDAAVELPGWCPPGLTVRSLGSHEAGLGRTPAWQWFMTRPASRPGLLAAAAAARPAITIGSK